MISSSALSWSGSWSIASPSGDRRPPLSLLPSPATPNQAGQARSHYGFNRAVPGHPRLQLQNDSVFGVDACAYHRAREARTGT